VRETFGKKTAGKRRTDFAERRARRSRDRRAMVVREPITSWCPRKAGSARCAAPDRPVGVAFKPTTAKFAFLAETTSKILAFATNAASTHRRSKLPGGAATASRCGSTRHGAGRRAYFRVPLSERRKFLVASKTGRGFVVAEDECLANTRKAAGAQRQAADMARAVAPVEVNCGRRWREPQAGDFPLDQCRDGAWRGVRLQRHKTRTVRRDDVQGQRRIELVGDGGARPTCR